VYDTEKTLPAKIHQNQVNQMNKVHKPDFSTISNPENSAGLAVDTQTMQFKSPLKRRGDIERF
jgi:hypothetical protein